MKTPNQTLTKKQLVDKMSNFLLESDEIFISQIADKIFSQKYAPINENQFEVQ